MARVRAGKASGGPGTPMDEDDDAQSIASSQGGGGQRGRPPKRGKEEEEEEEAPARGRSRRASGVARDGRKRRRDD